MLCKQDEIRTYQELQLQPTPAPTATWRPVAFTDAIDLVENTLSHTDLAVESRAFASARDNTQLFAQWNIDLGNLDPLAIALRGSINKTLAWSLISGAEVSACTNLDLWAGTYKQVRKSTTYVLRDLSGIVANVVDQALPAYEAKHRELESWRAIPADLDTGFELLGRAYGHKVLSPRQFTTACDSWTESEVDEHRDERNAYGVYAALTQGLKNGSAGTVIDRYAKGRAFFENVIDC